MGQRIGPVVHGGTSLLATRSHSFVGAPREAVQVHRRSFLSNKHHIGPQMTARPKHATAKARDEITNGLCFGCATMKPVRSIEDMRPINETRMRARAMKPLRTIELTHAVPLDGRGKRSPADMLARSERDHFLREAARRHCVGMSERAAAATLCTKLARYREAAWRRERTEPLCPPRHAGTVTAMFWCVLKARDHAPSEPTIRRALAFHDPRDVIRSASLRDGAHPWHSNPEQQTRNR